MTSTTTIPVGPNEEYLGDRNERLRSGAEQIASDVNVAASGFNLRRRRDPDVRGRPD